MYQLEIPIEEDRYNYEMEIPIEEDRYNYQTQKWVEKNAPRASCTVKGVAAVFTGGCPSAVPA